MTPLLLPPGALPIGIGALGLDGDDGVVASAADRGFAERMSIPTIEPGELDAM